MAGGVAVIKVGAATETEVKERKHRIEDAVAATKAAVEEGIIAGGGSALVHAAAELDELIGELTGDEATRCPASCRGRCSRRRSGSPRTPASRGRSWSTRSPSSRSVRATTPPRGEFADLAAAGIIDPVKVTRSAVANAASIAGMVLTTETTITDIKEPEPAAAGGHGHQH